MKTAYNPSITRKFLAAGLRRGALYLLMLPVYAASHLAPRDPQLWAFGSDDGRTFGGNARYLADYVKRKLPGVRPVWFATTPQACQSAREAGLSCVHPYSPKGMAVALRAGAYFITHHLFDVNPYLSGGAEVVQLWHGIPLKKIDFDTIEDGFFKRFLLAKEPLGALYRRAHTFQKARVVATSEETARLFESGFLVPRERIWITGYPRTDPLFKNDFTLLERERRLQAEIEEHRGRHPDIQIGLYAPTFRWRGEGPVEVFLGDREKMRRLDAALEAANLGLYVKLHPWEAEKLKEAWPEEGYRRIWAWPEGLGDPHALLGAFDFMVTDYSSIYIDYLLTGRPLVFFPFDLEEFKKNSRDLNYPYEEVTPGPKALDFPEFLARLSGLREEAPRFAAEREALKRRFYAHADGESSRRVAEATLKLLKLA